MTQAELNAYEARQRQHANGLATDTAVEKEADLHNEILAECRRRGWIAFYSRMDRATSRVVGEPDFLVLADGGKLLMIEAKSRTGKLSTEQLALRAWANRLGHKVFEVRSLAQFLEVISLTFAESPTPETETK
jgi:hypothetical protein